MNQHQKNPITTELTISAPRSISTVPFAPTTTFEPPSPAPAQSTATDRRDATPDTTTKVTLPNTISPIAIIPIPDGSTLPGRARTGPVGRLCRPVFGSRRRPLLKILVRRRQGCPFVVRKRKDPSLVLPQALLHRCIGAAVSGLRLCSVFLFLVLSTFRMEKK